ncbi:MAG: ribbon-helix-helix protein, CopG family [Euryarchaeota archaeon]|nr:ribbon-helix-helix protein, CopG family [Euryarchaeota archaeon]
MVVISVSLSARELREFEDVARQAGFSSRSDAVRDALSLFVSNNNWVNEMEGRVSCAVSVIYADRKKHHVHEVIHQYADIVHSSMHTHLEHRCVEQIVLDGPSEEVRKLLSELSSHKDVRIAMNLF